MVVLDFNVISSVGDSGAEDMFERLDDRNLFSATWRNLNRVSLEFHCPSLLDRFLVVNVVVTGLGVTMVLFLDLSVYQYRICKKDYYLRWCIIFIAYTIEILNNSINLN